MDLPPSLVEKCAICAALLAGLPLGLSLDEEMLGFKRFVWIGASVVGLLNLFFLDPVSDMAGYADKFCLALLSVALVPHFIQQVKDQQWMALGMLPPLFMVTHASMGTPIVPGGSEEYWRHRAFLHIFVYLMPYLNHLPSTPAKAEDDATHGVTIVEKDEAEQSTQSPSKQAKKSTKTRTTRSTPKTG